MALLFCLNCRYGLGVILVGITRGVRIGVSSRHTPAPWSDAAEFSLTVSSVKESCLILLINLFRRAVLRVLLYPSRFHVQGFPFTVTAIARSVQLFQHAAHIHADIVLSIRLVRAVRSLALPKRRPRPQRCPYLHHCVPSKQPLVKFSPLTDLAIRFLIAALPYCHFRLAPPPW